MTYLDHVIQYGLDGHRETWDLGLYDDELYDGGLIRVSDDQIDRLHRLLRGIWPGSQIRFVPLLKDHNGEQIPGTAYLDEEGFRLVISLSELSPRTLNKVI